MSITLTTPEHHPLYANLIANIWEQCQIGLFPSLDFFLGMVWNGHFQHGWNETRKARLEMQINKSRFLALGSACYLAADFVFAAADWLEMLSRSSIESWSHESERLGVILRVLRWQGMKTWTFLPFEIFFLFITKHNNFQQGLMGPLTGSNGTNLELIRSASSEIFGWHFTFYTRHLFRIWFWVDMYTWR